MTKSAILVTPRTHPNLRYMALQLLAHNIEPILLVQKVTKDFEIPDGCRVVTKESEIPHETVDFVLYRSFDKELRVIAKAKTSKQTLEIVYDQRPVGNGLYSRCKQLAFLIHRTVMGRPAIRVTPNGRFRTAEINSAGKYDHYFLHPGPTSPESGVGNSELQFSVATVAKEFDSRKKIDYLLRVLSQIRDPLNIVIIFSSNKTTGSSLPKTSQQRYRERIQRQIDSSHHNITIYRDITNDKVLSILGQASIFILPSKRESYSISNIEALSFGTQCLVRKNNGSSAFLQGQGTNTFKSPVTQKMLAAKIERLIAEADKKRRLNILKAYRSAQTTGPSLPSLLLELYKRKEIL